MKISLIQFTVEEDIEENFSKVKKFLNKALGENPDFILLPECFLFLSSNPIKIKDNALDLNSSYIKFFKDFAKINNLFLLLGSLTIKESNKIFNYSILINPDGQIVSSYKKIHLFDVLLKNGEQYKESEIFEKGNEICIFKNKEFILGHTICYDLRFPKLYRALAKYGSNIILVPSAFTTTTGKDHWHILVRSRAIENASYIIAPNQWGKNKNNRSTYGHSLVVNPWGKIIADGGEGEKVINCIIDLNEVEKARNSIPVLNHDQNFEENIIEKYKIVIK